MPATSKINPCAGGWDRPWCENLGFGVRFSLRIGRLELTLDIIIIMSNADANPPPDRAVKQSATVLQREQQSQRLVAGRATNFIGSIESGQAVECLTPLPYISRRHFAATH